MADTKLSDLSAITAAASNDIFYVVDVSDTTDDAAGSSKKITLANLQDDLTITISQISDLDTGSVTFTNKTIDADNNTISNIALGAEATGAIDDLSDVTISGTPADNELLAYNSASSIWINQTASEAGVMTALTDDASPQLAANLDASSYDITAVGKLDYDYATSLVTALGSMGTTETIDWSTGTVFTGTLDADITITHSNEGTGQRITLLFAYDGSAQRTITWSHVDKWIGGSAPASPSGAGEVLTVTLIFDGTTCYGDGGVAS